MSRRPDSARPPRLAQWLLARLLPKENVEGMVGDLDETFHEEIAPARGRRAARAWYWREALRAVVTTRRAARDPFDGAAKRRFSMIDVLHDLRFSARSLARSPWFTAVAVLTLAGGIGAATAVYGVARAYLLRGLPYPEPERVVSIFPTPSRTDFRVPDGLERVDFAGLADVFTQVAAWDLDGFTITDTEHPEYIDGAWVSPGFFDVVGARARLGRLIDSSDVRSGARVAVISDAFWRRHFGADSGVLGRTIHAYSTDRPLEAEIFTVVGVLPSEFWHVNRFTDLLLPLMGPRFPALARLAPGVTAAFAQQRLTDAIRAQLTGVESDWHATLTTALDEYVYRIRPTVLSLGAAAAFLLLIACSNGAALLLVRGARREREITIRAVIGAGWARVTQLLFAESVVLSVLGGAGGLLLAWAALDGLGPWVERHLGVTVPGGAQNIRIDHAVLAVALGAVVLATMALAVRPALVLARRDLAGALRASGQGAGAARSRGRLRQSLIAAQVALSLVLLIGAGLMARSVLLLSRTDVGFDPENVLKAHALLPQAVYPDGPARQVVLDRALERLHGLPGIRGAALVFPYPFRFGGGQPLSAEGTAAQIDPGEPVAVHHTVSAGYFTTMRIPIVQGRGFTEHDHAAAEPVAIISDDVAHRLWPGVSPLGRRIRTGGAQSSEPWRTVVGVTRPIRKNMAGQLYGDTYVPYTQNQRAYMGLVIRTAGDPLLRTTEIARALQDVAGDVPLHDVETMSGVVAQQGSQHRVLALLLGAFSAFALALALVGLYAVLAHAVSLRTRELAIRAVVGASTGVILRLVIREGLILVMIGAAAGVALSALATRFVQAQLYGVSPLDPVTYTATLAVVFLTALLAVATPAWRAAQVDPISALRTE